MFLMYITKHIVTKQISYVLGVQTCTSGIWRAIPDTRKIDGNGFRQGRSFAASESSRHQSIFKVKTIA